MEWDREYQRDLLSALRARYPDVVVVHHLPQPSDEWGLEAHLHYLSEHGLIEITKVTVFENPTGIANARITAQGLDFLADDGGLAAVLDVVTVKLDPADLRALLVSRIETSGLPAAEKQRVIQGIRSFSGSVLREVAARLVSEGLGRWPEALQLLQTHVGP